MEFKDYVVTINFATFVGADETYKVFSRNTEDAATDALIEAESDLTVESVENIGDDEWEVVIGFAGFIGAEETYTVFADSEELAEEEALQEASQDLSVEDIAEL